MKTVFLGFSEVKKIKNQNKSFSDQTKYEINSTVRLQGRTQAHKESGHMISFQKFYLPQRTQGLALMGPPEL